MRISLASGLFCLLFAVQTGAQEGAYGIRQERTITNGELNTEFVEGLGADGRGLSGRIFLEAVPDPVTQVETQRQALIQSLQTLQTAYCKAGMLDEAIRVREELRQLQQFASQELPQVNAGTSSDLLDLIRYPYQMRGRNGEIFYIKTTGGTEGSVWGAGPYTDDSDLGTAAVHAGVLQSGETKVVAVRIVPGAESYQGGEAHGVTTDDYGTYLGGFEILAAGSREDEVDLRSFTVNQEAITVYVTGRETGFVWGTDLYTNDSDLGAAAVHAGLLKVGESALIEIEFLPGLSTYPSATRNGVTSRTWGAWDVSLRLTKAVVGAAAPPIPAADTETVGEAPLEAPAVTAPEVEDSKTGETIEPEPAKLEVPGRSPGVLFF